MNTGRGDMEELLHVAFCRPLVMDRRIGINERQVLALQRGPFGRIMGGSSVR
jgi:hypothetical protein